jgi:hypothetical protein
MRPKPLSTLFLYILFTLLYLYPLPFSLGQLASIAPDMFQNLWNFWWVKKSLLDLQVSPYWTDYIFYPSGTSLAFQTFSPFNSLIAIPLQSIWNRIVAYNLLYIFTFVIAGLGGYLLTYHLVKERFAAFLGGFIYAFSPYHFSRVMHINIASIQWIPFYCLFLFRLREKPTWPNAFGTTLFLTLTAMCSWYYLIFLLIFTVIYLLYYGIADVGKTLKLRFFLLLTFSSLLFLLLIAPFVLPLLKEMVASESYLYDPVHKGLDLLGISVFKGYIFFWPVYLGYAVLGLSFYAVFRNRNREVKFWIIVGLFSFLMTFGTSLSFLGREIPGIPLPYHIMERIPIFRAARTPYRFLVFVMLSLSILSGYGIRTLRLNLSESSNLSGILRQGLPYLLSAIVFVEFLVIPRPTYTADIPPLYETISREGGDFAIASLPFKDRGWDLLYQTHHEKKIVWGYVSRREPKALEFLSSTSPFDLFYDPTLIEADHISPEEIQSYSDTLKELDIRHVLIIKPRRFSNLHKLSRPGSTLNFLRVGLTPYFLNRELHKSLIEIEKFRNDIFMTTAEDMERYRDLLGRICGEPYYQDDEVIAYRVD